MRLRVILPLMLWPSLFALGACGSSSSPKASSRVRRRTTAVTYQPAGVNPSKSAKMVCETEVEGDIADALGIKATQGDEAHLDGPRLLVHLRLPQGLIRAVDEGARRREVDDRLLQRLQDRSSAFKANLYGLGQGAFIAKNDDVVVRKDYKVLLVDVKNVPRAQRLRSRDGAARRCDQHRRGDHELLGRRVIEPGYAGR